jgi:hypothetical protein
LSRRPHEAPVVDLDAPPLHTCLHAKRVQLLIPPQSLSSTRMHARAMHEKTIAKATSALGTSEARDRMGCKRVSSCLPSSHACKRHAWQSNRRGTVCTSGEAHSDIVFQRLQTAARGPRAKACGPRPVGCVPPVILRSSCAAEEPGVGSSAPINRSIPPSTRACMQKGCNSHTLLPPQSPSAPHPPQSPSATSGQLMATGTSHSAEHARDGGGKREISYFQSIAKSHACKRHAWQDSRQ